MVAVMGVDTVQRRTRTVQRHAKMFPAGERVPSFAAMFYAGGAGANPPLPYLPPTRFHRAHPFHPTPLPPPMHHRHLLLALQDKRLQLKLNGKRTVQGTLRGFDGFMNLVLDETVEVSNAGAETDIGMVVIRGNSIVLLEGLEKL
jgi:small nuclear ribonucleoprotein G